FFVFKSRRRHTSLASDWSSDVCSSDLGGERFQVDPFARCPAQLDPPASQVEDQFRVLGQFGVAREDLIRAGPLATGPPLREFREIGRASCRERGESAGRSGRGWTEREA